MPATIALWKGPVPASFRLPVFDVPVAPATAREVVDLIESRPSHLVAIGNVNLRGVRMYYENAEFRRYTETSDVVLLDGWPLWASAWLRHRRFTSAYRVGSSDWLYPLLDRNPSLVITAVGGTAHASALARRAALVKAPRVTWHAFDGFEFKPQDGAGLTLDEALEASDLVVIGLGMPLQETWINAHRDALKRGVVANVGGCLDYLAGIQAHTPRWIGRLGIEWLYRLIRSPRRLGDRVFVDPLVVTQILVRNALGKRVRDDR
ncbi:WecB/TagA/CpsF family glycosyltransferase [Micrococcales bacterium 31B]|nr:WecB/TagA/CpsF family glycosyltransferase [Micrococcales bacterium 31B]